MKKPDFKKIANLLEMDFDTSTYPDGSLKNRDENVNLIAEALEQMYEQGQNNNYPITKKALDTLQKRAKAEERKRILKILKERHKIIRSIFNDFKIRKELEIIEQKIKEAK